jgi:UPF0716 protein FxsA
VPLLILLFIVVPIAELYVIIQVGQEIGVLPTIAILVADSILGSMLLRSQGRGAWRRFNEALAEGRPPAREVLDGALIVFGGAFLLTPGFLTDVIGLFLLFPPTRALVRRLIVRRFTRGFMLGNASRAGEAAWYRYGPGPREPQGGAPHYDVEGTAVEREPPALEP